MRPGSLDLLHDDAVGDHRHGRRVDEPRDRDVEQVKQLPIVEHPDHGLELTLQPGTEGRRRRAGW